MLTLAYPWVYFLVPLPILVAWFFPRYQQSQTAVLIPRLYRIAGLTGQKPTSGSVVRRRSIIRFVVLSVLWLCILTAVARPQFIGDPIVKTKPSRDLMLAVDLSGSMEAEDFVDESGNQIDRLSACKLVLDDFLSRREGDRVGLIFFGSAAFVQAPFTADLDLCRQLLDEAQVRMAGPRTVIGDAIGLSLTLFERSELEDRVLILLTDGNDTGSKVPPVEAARIARDQGVTIYTIAVGDPKSVGEEEIDEDSLKEISSMTGGSFFRAADRVELEEIYEKLDALGTRELDTQSYRPKDELFFWAVGVFLLIGLVSESCRLFFDHVRHGKPIQSNSVAATTAVVSTMFLLAAASPVQGQFGSNDDEIGVLGEVLGIGPFHFIRPMFLLFLPPVLLIIYLVARESNSNQTWMNVIHPEMVKHLQVRQDGQHRIRPWHMLGVVWLTAILSAAGPAWDKVPSPFTDNEAVVVFVQEVTPTMEATDIQPSRLQRSVHKMSDLLDARSGADAALIAYAGTAHLVMPITADPEIIVSFAAELSPSIMPVEGDRPADAIQLANKVLTDAGRPGSIVWLTDGTGSAENAQLQEISSAPVHILAVAGDDSKPLPPDSPPAPALNMESLSKTASSLNASVTVVTADDKDVESLARNVATNFKAAQSEDDAASWRDMGYALTPWIALITAYWFRRGWVLGAN